jgi:hypothetical protein
MKTFNRLRTLATSLSLVILSFGFAALGLTSFTNNPSIFVHGMFSIDNDYAIVGSSFSFLVGTTFLVAAITFRGVRRCI